MIQNTTGNETKPPVAEVPTFLLHRPTFPTVLEDNRAPTSLSTFLRPGFTPGQFLSSSRSPAPSVVTEDLTKEIMPHKIRVKVMLTWDGQGDDWNDENDFGQFPWIDEENYGELLPTDMIDKRREKSEALKGKEVFYRHGSCRISASPELTIDYHCILEDAEVLTLADKAIPLVCGFIHYHPRRKFSLQIYWEFGYARLRPEPDAGVKGNRTFRGMIKTELGKKQKRNYRGQEYISRRDQAVFQRYEVVHDLVFLDKSLDLDPAGREKFVREIIQRPALKLLLTCVFVGHNMAYLHHLLDVHKCDDDNLPGQRDDGPIECRLFYCNDQVNEIVRDKARFYVRKVEEYFQYHRLEEGEVMPLRPTLPNSGLKSLGNGFSGTVYEVSIDSAHHYLTGDPLCSFALKKFPAERTVQFGREIMMLKILADHPNPYIVPYITSWTQSEDHYILYEAARYNLKTFMRNVEPVAFTKHEILWFLRQLQGLALAIHDVHNVTNPTKSDPDPKVLAFSGCHHDIKPENILVFEKVPGSHPRFKVGDFGSGSFNPPANPGEHSRVTEETKGTLTYYAPDKDRKGVVSRPFDMWALGCVYLELMCWMFRFFESSESGESGFSTARFNCTAADDNNRTDTFWDKYWTPQRGFEYKLKSVVVEVMAELRDVWCAGMPAFQDILTAISKLLEIQADDRWEAVKLKSAMMQTVQQAEELLTDYPDFYSSRYEANCKAERQRKAPATLHHEEDFTGLGSVSAAALAVPDGDSTQEGDGARAKRRLSLTDSGDEARAKRRLSLSDSAFEAPALSVE
ncbi:uncharacterized protein Z520_09839 [Fonsecaea multimorphosa CBS 102226]|uniref:Protein kinase domain-containing protein n=1 Tax=Fonsecaea multimorphosa CBS 102226 TaxID=1442371 RepID=A0A0D2KCN4_9EURO|nr:uncharacterized protein Z520_09839 [Fonsecaea multimorphosa CBS 102226]KIX94453.1 hypothetical protein Z520_09839 [Fonsecaea multimorphosa CBS 102226]OAL20033.1 hypothetical protein AYO22_09183 [Fonsecaea multimorphosa]